MIKVSEKSYKLVNFVKVSPNFLKFSGSFQQGSILEYPPVCGDGLGRCPKFLLISFYFHYLVVKTSKTARKRKLFVENKLLGKVL